MTTLGLFLPGTSPVHRAPAGPQAAAASWRVGAVSFLLDAPWQVGTALALVVLGYLVAGLSAPTLLRQARPLLWLLLAVGVVPRAGQRLGPGARS